MGAERLLGKGDMLVRLRGKQTSTAQYGLLTRRPREHRYTSALAREAAHENEPRLAVPSCHGR